MADARKVKLGGREYEGVIVEIGEHKFRTLPRTRSVVKKMRPFAEAMVKAEMEGSDDDMIAALAAMFDVRLVSANGGRKKASTVITEMWRADQLTREDLDEFAEDLADADRPT